MKKESPVPRRKFMDEGLEFSVNVADFPDVAIQIPGECYCCEKITKVRLCSKNTFLLQDADERASRAKSHTTLVMGRIYRV